MPKYDNMEAGVKALRNFGHNYTSYSTGCCAFCETVLRERRVRVGLDAVVDSFVCDLCGRVYMEGPLYLLVQVGRREKCERAGGVRNKSSTLF